MGILVFFMPQLSVIRVTSSKEKIQLSKLQNPINIRLLKLESRVAQSTEVDHSHCYLSNSALITFINSSVEDRLLILSLLIQSFKSLFSFINTAG